MVVAVLDKTFPKEIIGKDTWLWKTVDAALNFEVHPVVADKFEEIILVNEFLWDVVELDLYTL